MNHDIDFLEIEEYCEADYDMYLAYILSNYNN